MNFSLSERETERDLILKIPLNPPFSKGENITDSMGN